MHLHAFLAYKVASTAYAMSKSVHLSVRHTRVLCLNGSREQNKLHTT